MEFLSKLWANPQVRQIGILILGAAIQYLTGIMNQIENVEKVTSVVS